MDSPVRKMQKRNDYNRHKLLRKIRRQRRAQVEQQKVAAEKELKRRLRVTPPKFGDGKEPTLLDADKVRMNEQGLFQDEAGNIVGDSVVLPELTVRAHKGYKSAYDREMLDNTIGAALDFVPGIGDSKQAVEATDEAFKGNYGEAAMLGGLLFLPNIIEKPLRYTKNGVSKFIRNRIDSPSVKNKGYWRIANDLITDPARVIKDYKNGEYPITRKQQKDFINYKNAIEDLWIQQAQNFEKEQALKRYQMFTDFYGLPSPLFDEYNKLAPVIDRGGRIGSTRSFATKARNEQIAGLYTNGRGTINYLNREDPYSNFNNYWRNKDTFMHEYTHRLQDAGQGFMSGNRYLSLGEYNPASGYYVVSDNAFDNLLQLKNNKAFDTLKRNSDETIYRVQRNPNISNGNVHYASPDEAIADWRMYRLTYPQQSAELMMDKKPNFISKFMQNEYGLSIDDLIQLHNSGYDCGKSPRFK